MLRVLCPALLSTFVFSHPAKDGARDATLDNIIDVARVFFKKEKGDEVTLDIVQMRQRGFLVRRSVGQLTLRLL